MKSYATSDARARFAELVETAQSEPVAIDRHGETQAVVVSMAEFVRMRDALEDLEDIAAFDAAFADPAPSIPWEQVKADLGWL